MLHSGCVLGADGFGFVLAGDHYEKFPQIGCVEIGDDVETEAVIENSRRYHRGLLAELKPAITTKGVKAHFEVAVGHPAEQIIYDADRHGVDLVVVGDRGRSKITRWLLGSVSKQVVQYAGRPVLVAR